MCDNLKFQFTKSSLQILLEKILNLKIHESISPCFWQYTFGNVQIKKYIAYKAKLILYVKPVAEIQSFGAERPIFLTATEKCVIFVAFLKESGQISDQI